LRVSDCGIGRREKQAAYDRRLQSFHDAVLPLPVAVVLKAKMSQQRVSLAFS
jgi:hypothetical protein